MIEFEKEVNDLLLQQSNMHIRIHCYIEKTISIEWKIFFFSYYKKIVPYGTINTFLYVC